jgi:Lon-like ATP-dependent protease
VEIFFRALQPEEVAQIARNAARKINYVIEDAAIDTLKNYATNGRDAVNIIQIAAGIALHERGQSITVADIEWVIHFGQYNPRPERKISPLPQIGYVNGLGVYGANVGAILEVEVTALPNAMHRGNLTITGVVDEEEIGIGGRTMRRKSMAKGSLENVLTVLSNQYSIRANEYDIHVNFPGGYPVDGPSAGITIAAGIYSAIKGIPIDNKVAMTGEISIRGLVKPVGGVSAKISAAKEAGVRRVIIPKENWQQMYSSAGVEVIGVETVAEVLKYVLLPQEKAAPLEIIAAQPELLSAASIQ